MTGQHFNSEAEGKAAEMILVLGKAASPIFSNSFLADHVVDRNFPERIFNLQDKISKSMGKGGIRSSEEDEIAGLDIPEMGVAAYPEFVSR